LAQIRDVPSVAQLLSQLRRIESAVSDDVRNDDNFLGLRVDESGRFATIARLFFRAHGENDGESDVASRLRRNPAFAHALREAGLTLADDDDATATRLHKCAAGDAGYASRCSDHCHAANRAAAGTLGWFFCLDGTPVCVGSRHVFCQSGDRTPLHSTCVYWRAYNDDGVGDYRIGTLWNYDRDTDSGARLFDSALIKIDDVDVLSGTLALCDDGLQRPYPLRLASEGAISSNESFYMIGMLSRTSRSTRFKGVGSRKFTRDGTRAQFDEQLFFERCSIPGDSGAVIVHERSNAVAGLTLAADALFTIANPLYRKPWRYAGLRRLGSLTLPDLRSV
jgi:hypothetical protein